ncbi:MAG: hypothetical protein ACHQT8_04425, partial [Chlamydiales bacterium]
MQGVDPVSTTLPPVAVTSQPNSWDGVQKVALRVIQSPLFWTLSSASITILATALNALPVAGFALACSVSFFCLF